MNSFDNTISSQDLACRLTCIEGYLRTDSLIIEDEICEPCKHPCFGCEKTLDNCISCYALEHINDDWAKKFLYNPEVTKYIKDDPPFKLEVVLIEKYKRIQTEKFDLNGKPCPIIQPDVNERNSIGMCKIQCISGAYNDHDGKFQGQSCKPCSLNCRTCETNGFTCTSCFSLEEMGALSHKSRLSRIVKGIKSGDEAYLFGNMYATVDYDICEIQCQKGFYAKIEDPNHQICQKCDRSCQECTNDRKCKSDNSCSLFQYLNSTTAKCENCNRSSEVCKACGPENYYDCKSEKYCEKNYEWDPDAYPGRKNFCRLQCEDPQVLQKLQDADKITYDSSKSYYTDYSQGEISEDEI